MSNGGDNKFDGQPPPNGEPLKNPWEEALNEMDAPKKNEIGLGTVIRIQNQFISDFQKNHTPYTGQDILNSIKKDTDFQDPVIRGPVEVAKGDKAILALSRAQIMALGDVFSFSSYRVGSEGQDFYALLESTGNDPKKVEAILKHVPVKPKTENHLIISSALARELGVEDQKKDIRILDVYQKSADIDLDKI